MKTFCNFCFEILVNIKAIFSDNPKLMKREKTEYVLKKSLTSAYKPVVPNDIYKKNYNSK